MRLIKKANGKSYLRVSKKEWEDTMLRFAKIITCDTLFYRLREIGWRVVGPNGQGHYMCYPPNKNIGPVDIASHTYYKNPKVVQNSITRKSKDLLFLFQNPYKSPPPNFNPYTLKIEPTHQPYQFEAKIITLATLDRAPSDLVPNYDMFIDNKWIRPVKIDWIGKTVTTEDGNRYPVPPTNIKIRKNKT